MSVSNLDTLDDLGSFASDGFNSPTQQQQGRRTFLAPVSPSSPQIRQSNSMDLRIGLASPAPSPSSDLTSYPRNQLHSVNAVHMHIQENAKIPTFNQPIDRTNSSRATYKLSGPYSATSTTEVTAPETSDISMAEHFLSNESKHRQSLNQNYESLGLILSDFGFGEKKQISEDKGTNDDSRFGIADETQIEIDALAAAVDPTPWSEIEEKIQKDEEKVRAQRVQPPGPAPAPLSSHPHHYSYYPYGRHHQLPIPQGSTTPNNGKAASSTSNNDASTGRSDQTMAQALATAAAIASTQTTTPPKGSSVSPPPPKLPSGTAAPAPPYTKAQQTKPSITSQRFRHYQRQRANSTPPRHAVAHTTSRASVIAATQKKSQYGFGGNHTVPSVPAPPPMRINGRKGPTTIATPVPALPNIPDFNARGTTPPNAGAAYERKKQRAKDARVKLNESIERLSIAMSLAGSQSKQRNNLLSNRIVKTEHRVKSLQIGEDCTKLAEQAKKWDRPSFVGTAASVVQGLNSQCDSLMRELIALQDRLDAVTAGGSGTGDVSISAISSDQCTSHPEHKRHDHPSSPIDGAVTHATKRIRAVLTKDQVEENNESRNLRNVNISTDEKTIYDNVAKMLDPVSLSRCPCVSRRWRDMRVFDDDELWLNVAVKRFGFYNVRQWTEKMDDGDGTKIAKKELYRSMNSANVMPHTQQDGLSPLGNAKIPGKVSAWVFMVNRSNGETLRSVKREPGSSGPGFYQSRPVVELRIIIQNTGMANQPVVINDQQISVDISTRRSGGELKEIHWDDRFAKVVKSLGLAVASTSTIKQANNGIHGELCRLQLFETVSLEVHVNARGCSTTSKFQKRSNFTKLLVSLDGTTVPMVIPFLIDGSPGNN